MKVTATFSDGMQRHLSGAAIGDEFLLLCHARIVGADETLIDISGFDSEDTEVTSGELEVRLLLSRPERTDAVMGR